MTAFKGLLKKDFYISRHWMITILVGDLVLLLVPLGLGIYIDEPLSFMPIVLFMLLGFHIFFQPTMLLQMLHLEGKTQLWLYNTQSSRRLFISKFIVAFSYQFISQVFLTGIGFIIFQFIKDIVDIHIPLQTLFKGTVIFNVALLLIALYFACWVIFYWSIYHSLSRLIPTGFFRWLILFLLFVGYNLISAFIAKIGFISELVSKWTVPVMINQTFTYTDGAWETGVNAVDFPVMIFIVYVFLGFALFFFSSWLLDRKVEV
ncbi:hypothetical protein [Virgibacillus alimentarius]|uniref:ABC transporter permease n=1 Tax=Virgibacillus alimentarius TaxID=698769 RepID=A0ABS4SBX6_9BACI|nr:hypothetical protein [Virgibacillus alimentarius]MBP2259000.1 hypothetical protein [Virgibacillus alimentarius]